MNGAAEHAPGFAPPLFVAGAVRLAYQPAAVFFDLDGTLADTAADLSAPANLMRVERGLEPLPVEDLRRFASSGARGILGRALGVRPEDPDYEALRLRFLAGYEEAMCVHTRLFPGMAEVLDALESAGIQWGVVSNKVERYVRQIIEQLGLSQRSVCAIGGDTAGHAKPHPAPLLLAANLAAVAPGQCVYVGDDLRDIQAGRAAGMSTVAAAYGYCGTDDPPQAWLADFTIEHTTHLLHLLPEKG